MDQEGGLSKTRKGIFLKGDKFGQDITINGV